MNSTLEDEILSVNAIYGPSTLSTTNDPSIFIFRPTDSSISLLINFPQSYPEAIPTIIGSDSSGRASVPKGAATQLVARARTLLTEVFRAGEPCIYDLLEALSAHADTHTPASPPAGSTDHPTHLITEEETETEPELEEEPPWFLAQPVTEKKSTFLARAARVTSTTQARRYISHLVATDKRVARATHNITAWRIRGKLKDGGEGVVYADYDSDGETAAGSRVGRLLAAMDAWDVVVVVSRWYGGVLLGPDRFRIINAVAREAVLGLLSQGEKKGR